MIKYPRLIEFCNRSYNYEKIAELILEAWLTEVVNDDQMRHLCEKFLTGTHEHIADYFDSE